MHHLRPSKRLVESDWLMPLIGSDGSVTGLVPNGFSAYVRILHPATSHSGGLVSWAQSAAWSGRTMHRLADFHRFEGPLDAAIDTDWSPSGSIFPQSPNLFWP